MLKYQSKYKGDQIDSLLDFVNDNKDDLALKEEIPEIPSIPRNVSELNNDLGFITNTVNNLINYYKKTETYTKDEINTLVSAAASGGFIKVNELPTEDINLKAIYLVPYTGSRAKNLYEEYIYVDGDWEMIGTTKIDLSNYVTTTALNTALADYVLTTDLTPLLNAKQDKMQFETMPTASVDYAGKTYQFIGTTTNDYTDGYFYECIEDPNNLGTYIWKNKNVQGGGTVDSALLATSENPVQNKVIKSALDKKQNLEFTGTTAEWEALSTADKAKYSIVNFTDDFGDDEAGVVYSDSVIGSIVPFGGTTAPDGWFICDGQAISREDYSDLFNVIGTNFGEGDGSTTFNVPDLRGEFLRGTGTNSHSNQGSGGDVGEHQDGTLHKHTTSNANSYGPSEPFDTFFTKENFKYDNKITNSIYQQRTGNSGIINTYPSTDYYTSRPTNTSVNFIIKAKHPVSPMSDIIGNTDISAVGSTVTGAISNLNSNTIHMPDFSKQITTITKTYTSSDGETYETVYTASKYCWLYYSYYCSSSSDTWTKIIKINDSVVYGRLDKSAPSFDSAWFYLKPQDIVSVRKILAEHTFIIYDII